MAELSNTLYHVALVTYIIAMVAAFFRMAFTRVSVDGVMASTVLGRRVGMAGTGLAIAGAAAHAGSILARGLAAERVPWANMYEYSSAMAFLAVVAGLVIVERRLGFGHLMGFVLAVAVITMAVGLMLFIPAGPVVPALTSYWLKIHVVGMMSASSILIVGFVATALFLVKDLAERRVAARSGEGFGGSTVGAASPDTTVDPDGRPEGWVGEDEAVRVVSPLAQRHALSPLPFPVVPGVIVLAYALFVWRSPITALGAASVAALVGTAVWYAVPYLPPSIQLDNLGYRVIAFGLPILTFGIICGAIWAEEAWGRYWGWDPKETGSFFTWVLYAAYLHARSTHGWRGRRAAWVAVVAFAALMATYYLVNLWIVGLHSYAGV